MNFCLSSLEIIDFRVLLISELYCFGFEDSLEESKSTRLGLGLGLERPSSGAKIMSSFSF